MPNVSESFPKDADSACVKMVGKETDGIALVSFDLRNNLAVRSVYTNFATV